MATYTPEQLARRDATPWTTVQMVLAPLQFIAFIVSFALVVRFLVTGNGYTAANISVLIKIGMLWAITITGMIWEKEVFDEWFMAKAFFWEDLFNAVALVVHNLYFIAVWTGQSHESVMTLMLVAYISYLFNMGQFVVKGVQARNQKSVTPQEATV
jgi:3-vinyl bacteriochlorophyllide hydratase